MKKLIIVTLLLSLMLFAACTGNLKHNNKPNVNTENGNNPSVLTIKDYFPFTENNKYVYEGEGNEYASYTVYNDYITNNRIQTRTNNGGTETVKVIEYKDGELKELLSRGETYYRQNFTNTKKNDGEVLLKEPLNKGTSWITGDNIKKFISNIDVPITTPLGSYKALEVTAEGKDNKTINYYVKDMGLIKTVYSGNGYEVKSTLSKIEKNVPLVQSIKIFYPNMTDNNLNSINIDISFKTNEDPKQAIEKTIKDIEKQHQVLSTNAKINSLSLNEDDGMVYIDLSKEFVTDMNAGSFYESMILQSITNTLGVYYGVDKVYITVDGKPFESGHIMMKEGEPFIVNLDKVKE